MGCRDWLLLNYAVQSPMWIKTIKYPQLLLTAETRIKGANLHHWKFEAIISEKQHFKH